MATLLVQPAGQIPTATAAQYRTGGENRTGGQRGRQTPTAGLEGLAWSAMERLHEPPAPPGRVDSRSNAAGIRRSTCVWRRRVDTPPGRGCPRARPWRWLLPQRESPDRDGCSRGGIAWRRWPTAGCRAYARPYRYRETAAPSATADRVDTRTAASRKCQGPR